jgi:uridine kinase
MIGDKLIIGDFHHAAAKMILEHLYIMDINIPYSLSISGESGSGKSEIAQVLCEYLESKGNRVLILGQDDYFRLPPHSNHQQRKIDMSWVGPMEVQLQLMNEHVRKLCCANNTQVIKPLIDFSEDKIGTEMVSGPFEVVIAEGTYTALLANVNVRVFIDGDYRETKLHRLSRNRDQTLENNSDDELTFLEQVLQIEHEVISKHKNLANIIIPPAKVLMKAQ